MAAGERRCNMQQETTGDLTGLALGRPWQSPRGGGPLPPIFRGCRWTILPIRASWDVKMCMARKSPSNATPTATECAAYLGRPLQAFWLLQILAGVAC